MTTRNTATEPTTRPDYSAEQQANWRRRHEEFVARARAGEVDVLFLGDSLTDHWRTHGLKLWEQHFAPLRAANFGLAGDRTQQVLWRILHGELNGIRPRVVVLLIGTNNLNPGLGSPSHTPRNTPQEIIAGVQAILTILREKIPHATLLLFGIFPRGETSDPLRGDIATINAGLRLLGDGQTVHFHDIGADFLEADGSISPETMPDLLHLRERSYARWADRLVPLLHEALRGGAR